MRTKEKGKTERGGGQRETGKGIMRMHEMRVKQERKKEERMSRRGGGGGQLEEEQMEEEFFCLSFQSAHLCFFI